MARWQNFINVVLQRRGIGHFRSSFPGGDGMRIASLPFSFKRLQGVFEAWVYVYDETKALKTGKSQWGLHFFRNPSYQRHRVNQSKFHFGHEFGALGLLCRSTTEWLLFPVWVKLILPQTIRDKSQAVLQRICSKIPPGLIIFDRGFARRKVFTMVRSFGHHILCRAKSKVSVFYRLPQQPKRPQRGRPPEIRRPAWYSQVAVWYGRHRRSKLFNRLKSGADENVWCRSSDRRHPQPSETFKTVSVFLRLYNRLDAWDPADRRILSTQVANRNGFSGCQRTLRLWCLSSEISEKHQSVRLTEFRCSKSDEVDIHQARCAAERDKCWEGLSTSRYSLVSPRKTHTGLTGGLSPVTNSGGIIFCEVQTKNKLTEY